MPLVSTDDFPSVGAIDGSPLDAPWTDRLKIGRHGFFVSSQERLF